MTSVLSDEVNILVYRYLQESGYQHSAFSFGIESHVAQSNVSTASIPPGALINIIQKGIQFTEGELCINDGLLAQLLWTVIAVSRRPKFGTSFKTSQHDNFSRDLFLWKDGSIVENLDTLGTLPLIDAVIPEALTERAATIYRLVAEKSEISKKTFPQNVCKEEESIQSDAEVLLEGHKTEISKFKIDIHRKIPYCDVLFNATERCLMQRRQTGNRAADGIVGVWKLDVERIEIMELDHNPENDKKIQSADVTSLIWHPDGNLLATTSALDHCIRVWNKEGLLKTKLVAHEDLIMSLNWNKKGDYLLSASIDKKCIIWDVENWQQIQVYHCHLGPVVDTDWLNTTTFASCSTDKRICICRVGSEEPVEILNGHSDVINCVEWDPSGSYLASCSDDRLVKVWDMKNNKSNDLVGHTKEVSQIKWNCRNLLASASYDASVRIWDMEQSTCLHILTHHCEPVTSISFHPSGQYLVSGSHEGLFNLWSLKDGSCIHSSRGFANIFEVQWSPDGTFISVCQADKVVKLLEFRKLVDR